MFHDFKIEFNESLCMWFPFFEKQTYSPFTVASCLHAEGKLKGRKLNCDVATRAVCAGDSIHAVSSYSQPHCAVQFTSTTHCKEPLYALFASYALVYPSCYNNSSSISSLWLEMFLNRILKSAIMKHYVIVSVSPTQSQNSIRTL
jgi:hypothetical protein